MSEIKLSYEEKIKVFVDKRIKEVLRNHNAEVIEDIPLYKLVEEMKEALSNLDDDAYGISCTMRFIQTLAEIIDKNGAQ